VNNNQIFSPVKTGPASHTDDLSPHYRTKFNSVNLNQTNFTTGVVFDDTTNIGLMTDNGTSEVKTYANGVLAHTIAYTRSNVGNWDNENSALGCLDFATKQDFWQGLVCEIIIYDSIISDADKNSVGNYMNAKWGAPWTDI